MLHIGQNEIEGIKVTVVRKRVRRFNLSIPVGCDVRLSLPLYWGTLREAEAFLMKSWPWIQCQLAKRTSAVAQPKLPPTPEESQTFIETLSQLHASWCARLGEAHVTWKLRRMKSIWGSCHWRKRHITYNSELFRYPTELIEYVVVHELVHLQVHNHGPAFQSRMDAWMSDWRLRRRRLR